MATRLDDASLATLRATLSRANQQFAAAYPGDRADRQPVHTVYGGAHLFKADVAERLGGVARAMFAEYAPDAASLAEAVGIADRALAAAVHARVADKLQRVVDNVRNVLAIELLCAAQGVDFRAPHRPGPALAAAHDLVRQKIPHVTSDRPVHRDIAAARALLDDGSLLAAARAHLPLE